MARLSLTSTAGMTPKETGLYSCEIAVGGDIRQVVVRGPDRLVTLPEIYLLQSMHGTSAVTNIVLEEVVQRSPNDILSECQRFYGVKADTFFRQMSLLTLPFLDHQYPTRERKAAADAAAKAILNGEEPVKAKPQTKGRKKTPGPEPVEDPVIEPELEEAEALRDL